MAEYTARTLTALLENAVTHYPDRPVISCEGVQLSYAELDRCSWAWAAFFQHHGLKPGERVALIMPNLPQFPIIFFGILKAGGIAVLLNPLYTSTELKNHLIDSGSRFIITLTSVLPTLEGALPLSFVDHIILASPGDFLSWNAKLHDWVESMRKPVNAAALKQKHGGEWWEFLQAQNLGHEFLHASLFPTLKPDDLALIQYTAGTVSASKGVMLHHQNLLAAACQAIERTTPLLEEALQIPVKQAGLVIIAAIPLYHIFALSAALISAMILGGCARLVPDPRRDTMLLRAMNEPFHVIIGVTTLFNKVLALPDFSKIPFNKLCFALNGGMSLPISVAERWRILTGAPMLHGYGLTETAAAVSIGLPSEQKNYPNYHVGCPFVSTKVQIRHNERNWTHPHEIGEIWVQGPQVMSGYWNRAEETSRCLDADGWFNTGDIGFWDTAGHLHWVDRKKDVVDISGFKVWPSEIESVALSYPGIQEAVAYGVPDLHQGETLHIALILELETDFSVDDFLHHCHQHLAAYKIPSHILHYVSLPRNSLGKVRRTVLQEHASAHYAANIAQCRILKQNDEVI